MMKAGLIIVGGWSAILLFVSLAISGVFAPLYAGSFYSSSLPFIISAALLVALAISGLVAKRVRVAVFWITVLLHGSLFLPFYFAVTRWPGGDDGPGLRWLSLVGGGSCIAGVLALVLAIIGIIITVGKRNTMKHPVISSIGLAVLAGIPLVAPAVAGVTIDHVDIDFVTVGNPGNAADTADGDPYTGGVQRRGAVAYAYNIAKNETTISQYAAFLNQAAKSDPYGLYNPRMSEPWIAGITRTGSSGSYVYAPVSGSANKPITYVSWFDAARFCNWMSNGQGSGSTETGAYTLHGAISGIYLRNVGATYWIPSEDEWYKAAYYDATKGGSGGYWAYPTQSDALAGNTIGVDHSANYYDGDYAVYNRGSGPWGSTDVGAYGANSDSFYETNDQGGNVSEWNDAVISSSWRGSRGGNWDGYDFGLAPSYEMGDDPSYENYFLGFRVASVPEPSCLVLTLLASGGLVIRRKR